MGIECVQYVGHSEDPRDSPCVLGTGWTVGNECVQYVGHSEDPKDSPCVHSKDPKDSPCVLGTVGRDGQWGLSFGMWDTVKIPGTHLVSLGQWDGMDSGE